MDFITEKIRVMTEKLSLFRFVKEEKLKYSYIECPEYKVTNIPPLEDSGWKVCAPHTIFEGIDTHYWLHLNLPATEFREGKELRLSVRTGREGKWDATNPQFTVFINGITTQAMDTNHTWIPLEQEKDQDIYLYLYTGMEFGSFEVEISFQYVDIEIEKLYYDVKVPYDCMLELKEDSYDYIKIRDCLDKALMLLDLRHVYSENFYESVRHTLAYLKDEFYDGLCGNNNSIVSCIGHTHIDVAWLWTVAQTKEKAQRSFSTVMNLIKRYSDYIFMSSQPQLYQYVKENDPELYGRIKEAIKEGRWEPEGAMWLEADTNLISGESLIRQILYGKRFMKEEFGVDNKILWLPDVFGYSGALPQILRKCGVTQFFTTKMYWNETNSMPNDIFIWEGIDGSSVFAYFATNYVRQLNPKCIYSSWKNFKNKSLTNCTMVTCGFGDGGGGTTPEMMENYERLKYGIPGIPLVKTEKAGDFLNRVEKDFTENTKALSKTSKWVGEMYLETHRGTYTSIAKNKKNNRKCELLHMMAEGASVADMVLCGGSYPEETFRKNMFTILLNQFHDIIPGSSIGEVYDVTDLEYAQILEEETSVLKEKLAGLKQQIQTQGGILVWNHTPFTLSDQVTVEGRRYYADQIPSHGWKVIPDKETESDIVVTAHSIENDMVKVIFNDRYHITSVYDKEVGREVICEGKEANCLEVYEDYPKSYDAWNINDYYKQKMWIADDVAAVTLLPDGIRVERIYEASRIKQDIVLRKGSKRIDFVTTIDWHEDHVLLKAAFPVDVRSNVATCDIQFGNLERPTHRNTSWDAAKFEICAHKWVDMSEGNYGVSVLNDCKYGYSVEDNVIKLSLLKTATYPYKEADRGMHQFTYSLYPHQGDYRKGKVVQEGYLLNTPFYAETVTANAGLLPECYSLVSSDHENIVAETIKKAEDDSSVIVRLYETYNQKVESIIKANFDFKEVYLCDMMEMELEKLPSKNRCLKVNLKNFEIATLKFVRV